MIRTKTPAELLDEYTQKWTADLDAQIRNAGGRPECPVCDSDEWTLMGGVSPNGELDGYGLPYFSGLSVAGYIPAMTVACKKCGFVKQHVFRAITEDSNE